jgi:cold shock CspA family protein
MSLNITPAQVLVFADAGFLAPVLQHYKNLGEKTGLQSAATLLGWSRGEIARRLGRGAISPSLGEARLFLPAADRTSENDGLNEGLEASFADAGFVLQKSPPGSGAAGHQLAMAVEILDQSLRRAPDAVVLAAGFGGLAPLVRKLTSAGIAVLVPLFDVPVTDRNGAGRRLRTAPALAEAATWAVVPSRAGDEGGRRELPSRDGSAGRRVTSASGEAGARFAEDATPPAGPLLGALVDVREKMGFLLEDWCGRKLFFHHTAVQSPSFAELTPGDRVEYERGLDHQGRPCAVNVKRLAAASPSAEPPTFESSAPQLSEEKPVESEEP